MCTEIQIISAYYNNMRWLSAFQSDKACFSVLYPRFLVYAQNMARKWQFLDMFRPPV